MDENPVISWLLTSTIPTIRYKTLVELKGLPHDHPECLSAYKAIQNNGPVSVILNQQVEPGGWNYPQHYYNPKYTSTHWSMILLEELMCDPNEPQFQAALKFMLSSTEKDVVKYKNNGFNCLFGNIIRYCVYGNKFADPRLQTMIDVTAKSLLNEHCKCDWNWQMPCVWGAARSVWGLMAIPANDRSPLVEKAISSGMEFVLENVNLIINNQKSDVEKKTHPIWYKLNFPIFYQADVLFVLRLLQELNQLTHPLAKKPLAWVKSKQKPDGRWQGTSPFRTQTYAEMGVKEETARWVTLQATSILNEARTYA